MSPPDPSRLRSLPSITEVLGWPEVAQRLAHEPPDFSVRVAREAVGAARGRLLAGQDVSFGPPDVLRVYEQLKQPGLRRVINAAGVVLHTNLGRAPLHPKAIARLAEVAAGYSTLELDAESGERGSRYAPLVEHLRALTGAEDALVVNNCAGAVLLTLAALGAGKEAIVSRGELVEIGGGFRVPDVMRQAGVALKEVGTTNRTRLSDYRAALSEQTGALVKVHRSNFAVVGFTEEASVKELAGLAAERGLPLFVDLGSGALEALHTEGLGEEPTVRSAVAAGASIVAFSGDKLLGGPQAGVLVGRRSWLAPLKEHPLTRALRVDKLTVAALEATLELYRDGQADHVPVRALLARSAAAVHAQAKALSARLEGVAHRLVETVAQVGGGCLPLSALPSTAVALDVPNADAVHHRLRTGAPSVVGRIVDGALWLDLRCVAEADMDALAARVREAVGA